MCELEGTHPKGFTEHYICITENRVKVQVPHSLLIYKFKNEVGCRDDTVPKTVETRRHCEED